MIDLFLFDLETIDSYLEKAISNSSNIITSSISIRLKQTLKEKVYELFQKQIENGGPVTVTDERITRFFMTIPEACQLVLEAGTMGDGGEIYVFDMGESVKIIDLAKKMISLSGLELGKDINIKVSGLRPGEKLYEELLANEENTLPTHHEKILIAKTRPTSTDQLQQIEELTNSLSANNNLELVQKMKALVPEFKSNNSEFEKLDK